MKKIKIITLTLNKETNEFDTAKLDEFLLTTIIEKEEKCPVV